MNGPRRLLSGWALCSVALAAAACGGGGGSAPTRHVTKSELAAMVLPRSAFGRLPAQLPIEHPKGFNSNAYAATRGSIDPNVTRASLTRAGRLVGYALGYNRRQSQFEAALARGSGLLKVVTEVELYRGTGGAASRMTQAIEDLRRLVGKPVRGGATLERGATFPLPRIGDAAVGLRFKVRIMGIDVYFTEVVFRYGRVLAFTSEARADSNNVDAAVTSFAQALDERITSVLRGSVRAEPLSPAPSSALQQDAAWLRRG